MWKRLIHSNIGAALLNMLVAYLVWMLSRVAFFVENWSTFAPYMSWPLFKSMLHGALVFDTSALLYVNSLYLVLMLLPFHIKERKGFHKGLKWLFVVTNAVAIATNLMDSVYFQYTGRRSTVSVFTEFANEGNIASILLTEFVHHWYLVLAFIILVFILWRCYTKPRLEVYRFGFQYYISQAIALVVMIPLAIVGIRGSVTAGTRPITISNANEFVNRPVEASELFKKLDGSNIWEFRTLYNKTYYRLFAFWDKDTNTLVVATHGIVKKTQKTPSSEIAKAEGIRKQYFEIKNKEK